MKKYFSMFAGVLMWKILEGISVFAVISGIRYFQGYHSGIIKNPFLAALCFLAIPTFFAPTVILLSSIIRNKPIKVEGQTTTRNDMFIWLSMQLIVLGAGIFLLIWILITRN